MVGTADAEVVVVVEFGREAFGDRCDVEVDAVVVGTVWVAVVLGELEAGDVVVGVAPG